MAFFPLTCYILVIHPTKMQANEELVYFLYVLCFSRQFVFFITRPTAPSPQHYLETLRHSRVQHHR